MFNDDHHLSLPIPADLIPVFNDDIHLGLLLLISIPAGFIPVYDDIRLGLLISSSQLISFYCLIMTFTFVSSS